ncbi:DUF418 domain-containing protein [Thermomonospora amylolytica]|uniref:DUF418 domain-containing protein n=1 Tax=Thermomonospora amylolytica TaxID=1411117 RepID=UPI000E6CDC28|nr:DUF418 domain-containing protein [Thermomonospora amylolytica]
MTAPERIREIDAVRGLALCGILPPNIVAMTGVHRGAPVDPGPAAHVYETLLHQRFFPLFSFLFGLGSVLFLRSARLRSDRPRDVLLARFGFLVLFGVAHQMLQPNEILLPYALAGIAVVLPASWLPRWATLVCGIAFTAASLAIDQGGITLIPGLFLLGMAAAEYDLPDLAGERGRSLAVVFAVTGAAAIALNVWQIAGGGAAFDTPLPATAGVVTAAAYATGLLMLLRVPGLGGALSFVLEPLGRLALTNYITASALILAADALLDLGERPRVTAVAGTALAILALQTIFSRLWLRRFRQGPLEWVWRCLTWWRLLPNALPSTGGRTAGTG